MEKMENNNTKISVPTYIYNPAILLGGGGKNFEIFNNELKDLCCDEYLFYLEQIPDILLKKVDINTLFLHSAKNDSVLCKKYLSEHFLAENKFINRIEEIFNEAKRNKSYKFVEYILLNYANKLKITSSKILSHSYKMFTFIVSKCDIESIKNEILILVLNCGLIFHCKYMYKNYKYSIEEIKEIFFKHKCLHYDCYKWILNILGDNIDIEKKNELIITLAQKAFIDYRIIKYIPNISESLLEKQLKHVVNLIRLAKQSHEGKKYEETHKIYKDSFEYYYLRLKKLVNKESIELIHSHVYNNLSFRKTKISIEVCEFLIDNGYVIDDFKMKYYDYYIYKKTIEERANYIENICKNRLKNTITL